MSTEDGSHARYEARRAVEHLEATRRGPQRPLEALERLRHAQEAIDRARIFTVAAARREGANWSQIGRALGITRQAARQAQLRRDELDQARAEAKQWHLPLPVTRKRWTWLPRRPAA